MTSNKSDMPKKRQLNPATLIWIAVFFFFIDYIVFHKPPFTFIEWLQIDSLPKLLSNLIVWLLVVTPLSLIAIALFLWGLRGQSPSLDFFSYPLPISTELLEDINGTRSLMGCGTVVFLIVIATIAIFGK